MGKRGPVQRPTVLRVLEGNPGKRPIKPHVQMEARTIPEPPPFLSPHALEEWHRLAPGLFALKLLADADVGVFAAYCQAYGRWKDAENTLLELRGKDPTTLGMVIRSARGTPIVNPLIYIASGAMRDMHRLALEFGMTPSARSRIDAEGQAAPTSKWAGLIGAA